jgi:UDPglucose 6-dehydrogenase
MRVCVFGLWHLGTVTAACLAAGRHEVIGLDDDAERIAQLARGKPPLHEPGLEDLLRAGIESGRLRFTSDAAAALAGAEVVWVTYDTPVDEEDRADSAFVVSRVESLFPHLADNTLVVVSSQLPVGSVASLEKAYASRGRKERVTFACSPENLRLGKAIDVFMRPDRVVAGVRSATDREKFAALVAPFTTHIEWMSVESAEMSKHALNAFLATSVTFINEIATICEEVGADAKEVERALKSDARIGPRAYLGPGAAFAGGTLARDITFLNTIKRTPLISSVKTSNDLHRSWVQKKLQSVLGDLRGETIAVWGLAYKPGTDTLRRSASVELCRWLLSEGASVRVHDPAVRTLPDDLPVEVCASPELTLRNADAVVVATEWPEYRSVPEDAFQRVVVIDANRFLEGRTGRARYYAVGKP